MKVVLSLSLLVLLTSATSFAKSNIPMYPDCYRGTLKKSDGTTKEVFVSFKEIKHFPNVNRTIATPHSFQYEKAPQIGSWQVVGENDLSIVTSDDSLDGDATYEMEFSLNFGEKKATGFYKYHFFGIGSDGKQQDRKEEGVYDLKKCKVQVKIIDQ